MHVPIDVLPRIFDRAAPRGGTLTVLSRSGRETRSYQELLDEAATVAGSLATRGVVPGTRVGIVASTSFDSLICALAVWQLGGALVLLPRPSRFMPRHTALAQTQRAIDAAGILLVVTDDGLPALEGTSTVRRHDLHDASSVPLPTIEPDDIAVILFTSGSTAKPRGVVLTHRAIAMQLEAHRAVRECDDPSRDHFVSWVPLHQAQGLIPLLLRPMACGVPATLIPIDAFVADPALWLLEIDRSHATYTTGPNFGYSLATREIEQGLPRSIDLSSLHVAGVGGEAVDLSALTRFAEVTRAYGFDSSVFLPAYGLTEATCNVCSPRPGSGLRIDRVSRTELPSGKAIPAEGPDSAAFVSVGPPLPGLEIRIRSNATNRDEREVGEIQVHGEFLMSGYVNDAIGTAEAFENGWLRTGDLGYICEGDLFVTGRLKDTIVVRGRNYYATDIELAVESVDGVDGPCAAFPVKDGPSEGIGIALESGSINEEITRKLQADISKKVWAVMGIAPRQVIMLPRGGLPMSPTGKVKRVLLSETYGRKRTAPSSSGDLQSGR